MNLLSLILSALLLTVASQRPKRFFRADYRYEKAFNALYKAHSEIMPWRSALIRCQAEGAELMVPESLDEAESATLLIASDVRPYHGGVFVGIHDLYSEKIFVTLNGSSVDDTILQLLWLYEEPRHNGGRCVAMKRNGRLYVNPCNESLPFICKAKVEDIGYNSDCDSYQPAWTKGPGGHCYIVHKEPQNWFDAYATCLSAGGYLAILNSRKEADYLRDLFGNATVVHRRLPDSSFAFLGFSDLFQKHYYTTVLGTPLDEAGFSDWDRICTDSQNSVEESCGGIRRSGLLSTIDCHMPSMYFCEKTLSGYYTSKSDTESEEDVTHNDENITNSDPNKTTKKHELI